MFGFFKKKSGVIAWRESGNGNLTVTEGDWRITVYKAKNPKGFAYVLSIGKGDAEETFFSRRFKTEEEAKSAAETVFPVAISGNRSDLQKTHEKYCDD